MLMQVRDLTQWPMSHRRMPRLKSTIAWSCTSAAAFTGTLWPAHTQWSVQVIVYRGNMSDQEPENLDLGLALNVAVR